MLLWWVLEGGIGGRDELCIFKRAKFRENDTEIR